MPEMVFATWFSPAPVSKINTQMARFHLATLFTEALLRFHEVVSILLAMPERVGAMSFTLASPRSVLKPATRRVLRKLTADFRATIGTESRALEVKRSEAEGRAGQHRAHSVDIVKGLR